MSKHRPEDSAGWKTFLPLALVGVVAAGGITWYAVAQGSGGDGGSTDAAATTTSQMSEDEAFASAMAGHDHSEETSDPPEETTASTEQAEVTETESEEPVAEGVPEGLAACADSISTGETVAEAAAISAGHWKVHYQAQQKIDSGEYTFEQAGKDWANKKYGPEDVKRFNTANKAYDKVSDACADLDVDALNEEYADAATACVDRSSLLADVVKTGAVVNQDWSDHVDQMAVKSETPPDEYYEWWVEEVEEAPKLMKPYDQAVKAFKDAPACDVS